MTTNQAIPAPSPAIPIPATPHPVPAPRSSRQRLTSWLAAVAVLAAYAWGTALVMPRGPVRPWHVVLGILAGLAIGALIGYLTRSRWSILAAPAAFAAVYELARLDVVGPSVDAPRWDSQLGIIVQFLGRGLHGLTALLPLALGAALGVALIRRQLRGPAAPQNGWARTGLIARRTIAGLTAVALLALGIVLTRPGSTPPILGADGEPLPGSVAELATFDLGGVEQTVLLRGRSTTAPVLLYLAGGPGQSDSGYLPAYEPNLENDFVVAIWDQRGTGTSYAALDPTDTWTYQQAVADTIELSEKLTNQFGGPIYVVGNSWGTLLGVDAVKQRPELYAAYVGTGQMVNPLATDLAINDQTREYAARTGDATLTALLAEWGRPPYRDIYAYGHLITYYDELASYDKTASFQLDGPGGLDGNGAPVYGPLDKVNKLRALFDMGSVMYPQLQDIDFQSTVPALDVPVYLIEGAHELPARLNLAKNWYETLDAPDKTWVTFGQSGHTPQFEEGARFHRYLVDVVLAETAPSTSTQGASA